MKVVTLKDLTLSQLIILLSVWRLEDNAYGVTIRKKAAELTGRKYPYGTLYGFLDFLFKKGYVNKATGAPTQKRGGRRKILYRITPSGLKAIKAARDLQATLWKGIPGRIFDEV